ncbi:MAG: hypothetical protein R3C05_19810 [Pirellulaceae bacterium]
MNRSYCLSSDRVRWRDHVDYWAGMPIRLVGQGIRNSHDILRVVDLIKFHPLHAGMLPLDHPWVTGINPSTGDYIWPDNVIYRSARPDTDVEYPSDRDFDVGRQVHGLKGPQIGDHTRAAHRSQTPNASRNQLHARQFALQQRLDYS